MLIIETIGAGLFALSAIMFILLGAFSKPLTGDEKTAQAPLGSPELGGAHDLADMARLMARKSENRDIAA